MQRSIKIDGHTVILSTIQIQALESGLTHPQGHVIAPAATRRALFRKGMVEYHYKDKLVYPPILSHVTITEEGRKTLDVLKDEGLEP